MNTNDEQFSYYPSRRMSQDEMKTLSRTLGFAAGLLSKMFLEYGDCEVNFKINGEDISDLKKLHDLDITKRMELAIKEQRFEDAAKYRDILKINKDR